MLNPETLRIRRTPRKPHRLNTQAAHKAQRELVERANAILREEILLRDAQAWKVEKL